MNGGPYRRKRKKKHSNKLPPFVPITWGMLNSKAYVALKPSSAKALPYFVGKVKGCDWHDPQRMEVVFSLPYGEAKRYGFAEGTFANVIRDLIFCGFLDPYDKGGLRCAKKNRNLFTLSKRWEDFGTAKFSCVEWDTFEPNME